MWCSGSCTGNFDWNRITIDIENVYIERYFYYYFRFERIILDRKKLLFYINIWRAIRVLMQKNKANLQKAVPYVSRIDFESSDTFSEIECMQNALRTISGLHLTFPRTFLCVVINNTYEDYEYIRPSCHLQGKQTR